MGDVIRQLQTENKEYFELNKLYEKQLEEKNTLREIFK